MKYSEAIKPISYFKAHAAEIIRDVVDNKNTMIITQNGEAKVVMQGIKEYEKLQESMALLKILALSSKSINNGKVKTVENAFSSIKSQINR